ncbi:DUF3826 domain-containing protein [Niabella beijingensis]|uniref:DUF3826 domain-containing protein n=1 Tax=Niabella beijingensis TaxID=2872700 RepID=UPI001CBEA222|nr:DUF3826 domain-containing protein [Niabella beijingensis]MBZ4188065.1 DUF3826 domain-containing protein [Niabella beijingensis]
MKYFFYRKKNGGIFAKSLLIVVFTIFNLCVVFGRQSGADTAYRRVASQRAAKIVALLALKDSAIFYKVKEVVAAQYMGLNELDASRETAIRHIRETNANKEAAAKKVSEVETRTDADRTALHNSYIQKLSAFLDKEQVDAIKNGMTYNVLLITYKGYLEMIPRLTAEEQQYIMNALVEAREHAMDAGSSEKKHAWFGKYKGRINNYLSSHGYDMNKESKAWQERTKAKQNNQ